jgi:hypothetical protein
MIVLTFLSLLLTDFCGAQFFGFPFNNQQQVQQQPQTQPSFNQFPSFGGFPNNNFNFGFGQPQTNSPQVQNYNNFPESNVQPQNNFNQQQQFFNGFPNFNPYNPQNQGFQAQQQQINNNQEQPPSFGTHSNQKPTSIPFRGPGLRISETSKI